MSERRACRLVGQHRSSNRYVPVPEDFELKLVARMIVLAEENPKWGYRMIHALLVDEGWPVNKSASKGYGASSAFNCPPEARNPMARRRSATMRTASGACHRAIRTTSGPMTSSSAGPVTAERSGC